MPKWIGKLDVCGPEAFVIEAQDEDAARKILYDRWLQTCEDHIGRSMEPYTPERAEELEADDM